MEQQLKNDSSVVWAKCVDLRSIVCCENEILYIRWEIAASEREVMQSKLHRLKLNSDACIV